MSWRENDQPAGERDWAAAGLAAADQPFDSPGHEDEAEAPAPGEPVPAEDAAPVEAEATESAEVQRAEEVVEATEPAAQEFVDASEPAPAPPYDTEAEPAWWAAANATSTSEPT